MSEGTRVIVRTLNGPPGADGEITLNRLRTELVPYDEADDELQQADIALQQKHLEDASALTAHAGLTTDVHGIPDTSRLYAARGALPFGGDLDTLTTPEANGIYYVSAAAGRPASAIGLLEVLIEGTSASVRRGVQRYTASGRTWWRSGTGSGDFEWDPWQETHATRLDTSVGTRVFVGGVMVHGDTGPRDVSHLLTPDWACTAGVHRLSLRRVAETVFLAGFIERVTPGLGMTGASYFVDSAEPVPAGFRPSGYEPVGSARSGNQAGLVEQTTTGTRLYLARFPSGTWTPGMTALFTASWVTGDPWPTTLPGTPA